MEKTFIIKYFAPLRYKGCYVVKAEDGITASKKADAYLKEKYGYPSTTISLPDPSVDWVSKCRIIAPEIDAVAKRYNLFAKRGSVDDDLLQISSDTVRVSGAASCNHIKYYTIKGQPGELYRLFHLLFSDQSMLSFVDPFKDKHYGNSFNLQWKQWKLHISKKW